MKKRRYPAATDAENRTKQREIDNSDLILGEEEQNSGHIRYHIPQNPTDQILKISNGQKDEAGFERTGHVTGVFLGARLSLGDGSVRSATKELDLQKSGACGLPRKSLTCRKAERAVCHDSTYSAEKRNVRLVRKVKQDDIFNVL